MEKDNDMDAFIRDTLNSYQRIREKDRAPVQQTNISRTSTNFGSGAPPLTLTSNITSSGSVGGGGSSGTFLASLVTDENGMVIMINVTSGSYHILNTNTDVPATSGDGKYVYAVIKHSNAGIFEEFNIEISQESKDPTNLDTTGKFVEFSNVLLAEGMVDNSVTPPVTKMVQRRVGNLSLVHQVVSGRICLWAYSSGGTSL
jgi:hypothetical protein